MASYILTIDPAALDALRSLRAKPAALEPKHAFSAAHGPLPAVTDRLHALQASGLGVK